VVAVKRDLLLMGKCFRIKEGTVSGLHLLETLFFEGKKRKRNPRCHQKKTTVMLVNANRKKFRNQEENRFSGAGKEKGQTRGSPRIAVLVA